MIDARTPMALNGDISIAFPLPRRGRFFLLALLKHKLSLPRKYDF